MSPDPSVLVIGSVNQDITVRVERFAAPGETLIGTDVAYGLGGKGANQAVASARTGTRTALLATVGDDATGRQLTAWLQDRGVDSELVRAGRLPSGTAHIVVDARGENQIVVVPGANAETTADRLTAEVVETADVVVLQGEVPVATIARAIALAGRSRSVLNLAPMVDLAPETLAGADILVVNEVEAGQLLGRTPSPDVPGALAAVQALAILGKAAVLTLGAVGAVWCDGGSGHVAVPAVEAVDTTGAGDAFVGVLAAALARGLTLPLAVRAGVVAASRSVLLRGAAMSYPAFDLD